MDIFNILEPKTYHQLSFSSFDKYLSCILIEKPFVNSFKVSPRELHGNFELFSTISPVRDFTFKINTKYNLQYVCFKL